MFREANLTNREQDVLQALLRGLSAKEIAYELEVAPRTVEAYIERIKIKMRARNKTQLIVLAVTAGMCAREEVAA